VNIWLCLAAAADLFVFSSRFYQGPDALADHQSPDAPVQRIPLLEGVDIVLGYESWLSFHA